ncbi:tetratricopeptide repeat (TPR)-containing protein [Actinidia rufa]|uniref:Tetratricopeptide repeat (TPR)-containing protein n=1 Tax=Actinidia rufa TaxID=165716 RepID=A0A7J0EBG0_9ERIC|nr:tetratricopeptide repeat (TPR)-containing protein [Actinidia rufa]
MQNNIFTTMRSLKIMDGCKGTQVYALNPSGTNTTGSGGGVGEKFLHHLHDHLRVNSIRSKSTRNFQANNVQVDNNSVLAEALAAYGLPQSDLIEPLIEPCLKSVDFVQTLANMYQRIENCPQFEKSGMYLEQCAMFRGLSDPKLFRRSLRLAKQHAVDVHSKIVLSAWLRPFNAMLYGNFLESRREKINFTQNGISVKGMRAAEIFSRARSVDSFDPDVVLELLSLANRFCCEEMKSSCDSYLASLVCDMERALLLIDAESRERLALAGHASFSLYYFLSQIAMEDDMKSNTTIMLLERLRDCASEGWQKQLAFHQLGCVMLERKEYKDAQKWFEASVEVGHIYSLVGVARTKYKRGHVYSAYKVMNSLISDYTPAGWMYQERSLYSSGKEKIMDLDTATEMDPTLSYPYKHRAVSMLEENNTEAAISEINRIIGFKVSPDCLELRAWFSISMQNYEGALIDVRAILTLDPNYMMFHRKLQGDHLVELLRHHVQQWNQADCWMQLYDRWSCVDDIGSLAVVHHMLANDPGKSLLHFRQSLLLLRLNCQKAAMRSLRLARNHSTSEHERLVYEGWILYDTGHREEALAKAEESISIQRSFEAFFLKAYALADSNLDTESSLYVIQLLDEALRCPSDGLRKGQALNNLGSVYVDCDKLDLAADCYTNALNIKHTRAHQGLARVYHLKNQRKAAYDEMTKLIEKARSNASAYEKRSEYCDRDMAKSDLSMATKLDPLRTYPYRYRAAGK